MVTKKKKKIQTTSAVSTVFFFYLYFTIYSCVIAKTCDFLLYVYTKYLPKS